MRKAIVLVSTIVLLSGCESPFNNDLPIITSPVSSIPQKETDRFLTQKDGSVLITEDKVTGCKYIQPVYNAAYTPLLTADGLPDCTKPEE